MTRAMLFGLSVSCVRVDVTAMRYCIHCGSPIGSVLDAERAARITGSPVDVTGKCARCSSGAGPDLAATYFYATVTAALGDPPDTTGMDPFEAAVAYAVWWGMFDGADRRRSTADPRRHPHPLVGAAPWRHDSRRQHRPLRPSTAPR